MEVKQREKENTSASKSLFRLEHWEKIMIILMVYDVIAVNLAYASAIAIRFDFRFSDVPDYYIEAFCRFCPIYTVFCIAVFVFLKLYKSIWRFASYTELRRVFLSSVITAVFHTVAITLLFRRMPISYYLLGAMLQFGLVLVVRFMYRFVLLLRANRHADDHNSGPKYRVMLIGAGEAGRAILNDINNSQKMNGKVCCIIDDNPNKHGRYIDGVPVVGARDSILQNVEKYNIDRIYLAIPSASAEAKRDILNICKETGCELKNLPGIYQLVNGEITANSLKDVAIEDLLGRDEIELDMSQVDANLVGKTVLVTGGGGSIGSELCRQIAKFGPKRLIIFDVYENNAYDIQQELLRAYPKLDLVVRIGSVRDSGRLKAVFSEYEPEIVFHAAAHKHVPLMEESPCEAIKNNVIGTYKTAYAAMCHHCERFVFISTDKAVNPVNVMGASKRICEMIIQMFDAMIKAGRESELHELHIRQYGESGTRPEEAELSGASTQFVAVRFGNVLGSNGSVIPLFKKQIAEGGPVTVTDKRIIRYFMTIPEAVRLVLQASVMGNGSEIFVLDMGSPVNIDDLARNLIKLSGLRPDVDIKIEYSGLRPGEKLYEEKLMAEEGIATTPNRMIFIGKPIPFDNDTFLAALEKLLEASYNEDEREIRELLKKVVTTYTPADELRV